MELIRPFAGLGKDDAPLAGGKGASLGEMSQAGIPVPPGFVILSSAFERFLKEADLAQEVDTILHTVNHNEVHTVEQASEDIKGLILNAKMPQDIGEEVLKNFKELGCTYVAVRSSATAEDGAEHAWAGQLDTYLNTTEGELLENVKRCWASLFTPRAIFYRFEKKLHTTGISVAVVIQSMVESEVSGIAFSVHPITEDRNQLIIEGGFGLGEAIVSGQVTPDSYVVEKEPRRIIDTNVSTQTRALYRIEGGGNEWRDIEEPKASSQVLTESQVFELTELILRIEKHYGFPCDIEWAYEGGKFYITQSRPITTLSGSVAAPSPELKNLPPDTGDAWMLGEKIPNSDLFFFQIPWNQFPNRSSHDFLKKPKNVLAVFNEFEQDFYTGEKDADEVAKSILDALVTRPEFGSEVNEKIVEWSNKMIDFAKSVAERDLSKSSNKELYGIYDEHFEIHTKLYTYGWLPVAVDIYHNNFTNCLKEYLYEACESREKAEEAFVVLTTPCVKTILAEEAEELLTIAEKHRDAIRKIVADKTSQLPPELETELATHAGKWGHLGYIYAGNEGPFDIAHYLKELTNLAETNTTPRAVLEREAKQLAEARIKQEKLIQELSMPETYRNLFTVSQNFALTKLIRRHAQLLTLYLLHKSLLEEIAKRLSLTRYQVQFMLKREVKTALLEGSVNADLLNERLKHCVMYTGKDFEEVYVGEEAKHLTQNLVAAVDTNIEEFKGQTANPGKATGIVKFIFRAKDIPKMNEGDILVSIATDPDVVPAMKKAAAIVTEQGGITAHAAIVSRELGKPCIIGTKIATRVLQEGDLVEVDATQGIVRILKRAADTIGVVKEAEPNVDAKTPENQEFTLYVHDFNVPLNPWSTLTDVFQKRLPKLSNNEIPYLDNLFVYEKEHAFWGPKDSQFKKAAEFFIDKLANESDFLPEIVSSFKKAAKQAESYVERLLKTDFSELDNDAMYSRFKEGCNLYIKLWTCGLVGQLLEMSDRKVSDELKKRVADALSKHGDPEAVFARLMTPLEPSGIAEEYSAILSVLADIQADSSKRRDFEKAAKVEGLPQVLSEEVSALAERFGWLQYYYVGPPATVNYYFEILKKKLATTDAQKELEERSRARDELQKFHKAVENDLPEQERTLVEQLRTFAYLKEARKESQYHINFGLDGWYQEVASRFDADPMHCRYILQSEYERILKNGKAFPSKHELAERYRCCAYICEKGKDRLVVGDEALTYKNLFKTEVQEEAKDQSLQGSVAYPGSVKGRVMIVNSAKDMEKFGEGDVLVSIATTPVLVPAMHKAAAIITDTGGVTCHAAIVSRELKIPCIVGTKIATQVLKDGDLVEVDAHKGVINIIETANPPTFSSAPSATVADGANADLMKEYGLDRSTWTYKGFHGVLHTFFAVGHASPATQDFLGDATTLIVFFVKDDYVHWYWNDGDLTHIRETFLSKLKKDKNYLEGLKSEWQERIEVFKEVIKKVDAADLTAISNEELAGLYDEFYRAYAAEYSCFMVLGDAISMHADRYLEPEFKKILGEDFTEVFPKLATTQYLSFVEEEHIAREKLVEKLRNGRKLRRAELEAHASTFFYLHNNYAKGIRLTADNFEKMAREDVEKEPQLSKDTIKNRLVEKEMLIEKYKLSDWHKTLLYIIDEFFKLQDTRKKYVLISNYYQFEFLREAELRTKIPLSLLKYSIYPEFRKVLDGSIDTDLLAERQNMSMAVFPGHEYDVFSGPKAETAFSFFQKGGEGGTELKGMVASPGKITGRVKKILKIHDMVNMEKGDILVSSMTRPEMVPAMKLAGAIVTDEGGITSHAAIISRELGIPCIIGTKKATQILNDGDEVEVDANKGTVTKIS